MHRTAAALQMPLAMLCFAAGRSMCISRRRRLTDEAVHASAPGFVREDVAIHESYVSAPIDPFWSLEGGGPFFRSMKWLADGFAPCHPQFP